MSLLPAQRIDDCLRFVRHPEQLRPGAMIIFAGQFPGRVESHVRSDVLRAGRVIERIARVANDRAVAFRIGVRASARIRRIRSTISGMCPMAGSSMTQWAAVIFENRN